MFQMGLSCSERSPLFAQILVEQLACTKDVGLDGAEWQIEFPRYFVVRIVLIMSQNDLTVIRWRERVDGLMAERLSLILEYVPVGSIGRVLQLHLHLPFLRLDGFVDGLRPQLLLSEEIDRVVRS